MCTKLLSADWWRPCDVMALRQRGVKHVLARSEHAAGNMADAYARPTRRPGCVYRLCLGLARSVLMKYGALAADSFDRTGR